jgi:hypothetical protein
MLSFSAAAQQPPRKRWLGRRTLTIQTAISLRSQSQPATSSRERLALEMKVKTTFLSD